MKLLPLIKSLLLIYLLLCLSIYLLQRHLIFQPPIASPHNHETIRIKHGDFLLEALLVNPTATNTLVYFGGNAEDVAYAATDFETRLPSHKVYLIKYRGYAGAAGQPTEQNLYQDALAWMQFIQSNQQQNITVMGRSLGSSVATFVASKHVINRLILITPFDSIRAVAQDLLPGLPIQWLLKDHFDSKSRAHSIGAPTLILTAAGDQVITKHHSQSLANAVPEHLRITVTIVAGHNDIDLKPKYFKSINQFLNQ